MSLVNGNRKFKIFVDFDGTITKTDVGEALFINFGDAARAREIVDLYLEDKITSKETWILLCESINNFDTEGFVKFLDTIEIDSEFKNFVDFCKNNDLDIFVLSDGLDFYIDKILKREGLENLTVYSNKLKISGGKFFPVFPYTDEECNQCANCKRNHIITNSSDEDITIYIGDGWSDKCPAQYCDFIFAKDSLLKFCEKNRISYYPYRNFGEVRLRIADLLKRKRIRKRHQAELNRKAVYLQG
ncbi:MAG: 2-hydroxy-3-keto-5-methylthiopentenyl-1-phosphate phosphatase [Ignavibacteria bacterium]|nr:MAG: 2-hydroxy-3-keto-5-methylthiopentenyl-1-phosphate phosphatase [Ignavibacteria bacterium]